MRKSLGQDTKGAKKAAAAAAATGGRRSKQKEKRREEKSKKPKKKKILKSLSCLTYGLQIKQKPTASPSVTLGSTRAQRRLRNIAMERA